MGKQKLGFQLGPKEEKEKKAEATVRNVEAGFKKMITELDLEERTYLHELELERKVRRELVKIHKRIKKLDDKFEKRRRLEIQCNAREKDYPQEVLELLNQIDALDKEILPEAELIFKDLRQHALPDIGEMYKGMELSEKQIKGIRSLANTLSITLSKSMISINNDARSGWTNKLRDSIKSRIGV